MQYTKVISRKHGVPGIKSASESVHVKRGCEMSLETGCHYHVLHISTKESIDYVRAAKSKRGESRSEVPTIYFYVMKILKLLMVNLNPNFKMNPPLRSAIDRQACVEAFLDGTIDFVATDHAPHSKEEKSRHITEAPFGILGLETAFPLLYTHFVKTKKMSLESLVDKMTIDAAKVFNLPYGKLESGCSADLVLIDLEQDQCIDADKFASKGKNTPFQSWKCSGFPRLTIYNGNIVYKDETFLMEIGTLYIKSNFPKSVSLFIKYYSTFFIFTFLPDYFFLAVNNTGLNSENKKFLLESLYLGLKFDLRLTALCSFPLFVILSIPVVDLVKNTFYSFLI